MIEVAATRSELREKIMTILYQIEIYKQSHIDYNIDDIIKENVEIDNEFVKEIVYGVNTYFDELSKKANDYLENWKIERLDKTGASILRIALYELEYTDTPKVVVINEAVELSKKYSDNSVHKMINAVLDRIMKEEEK